MTIQSNGFQTFATRSVWPQSKKKKNLNRKIRRDETDTFLALPRI